MMGTQMIETCREVEINILRNSVHLAAPDMQTRHPPVQSEKYQCRIDTVSSSDDGHTVARNM